MAMEVGEETIAAFVEDPVEFFDWSYTKMMSLPPAVLADMQLRGLQLRFSQLRDRIAVVKKLADAERVERITTVEDVVPLLFEHTTYKSYPPGLLADNRFDLLTRWLQKLTTHDLSGVDTSGLDSIDAWVERLDSQSELHLIHSSGTTGTFSLLPWSKSEFDKYAKQSVVQYFQAFGDAAPEPGPANVAVVLPFYRSGSSIAGRLADGYAKYIGGGVHNLHVAFPEHMSSDMLYLAGRIRGARARGELDRLSIPANLLARLEQFERAQAVQGQAIARFLENAVEELRGRRVWIGGVWATLHPLAKQGLERGVRGVFSPDSVISIGGGAKGMTPPDGWLDEVKEFTGTNNVVHHYGMSEVAAAHKKCTHNHYHIAPWVIPFVLDPDTSRPLARSGVVTGRAAFFDLMPDSRWGGFITGDEITMHWDNDCPCGAQGPYAEEQIVRFSEKNGDDDKITCAATADAHQEAMDFLSELSGGGVR